MRGRHRDSPKTAPGPRPHALSRGKWRGKAAPDTLQPNRSDPGQAPEPVSPRPAGPPGRLDFDTLARALTMMSALYDQASCVAATHRVPL
jgi:hypothetical protein